MSRGRRRRRRGDGGRSSGSERLSGSHPTIVVWIAAAGSVVALMLCLVNASTCHFLRVQVDGMPEYSIGPFCSSSKEKGDTPDALWIWSAFFFSCALACSIIGTLLAVYHVYLASSSLSSAAMSQQRRRLWQGQSIVAAVGAILSVPTFLLYQSATCTLLEHACQWDSGSALMMVTCCCFIFVVLLTQCYSPDHVFHCGLSLRWMEKTRRLAAAATDLKVDRTMPNEDDDEEDEGPTAILRIVGPMGHSEGIEVPMDPYHHHDHPALTKSTRRWWRPWFVMSSRLAHAPLDDDDGEARDLSAMIEEGRAPPLPKPMPVLLHSSRTEGNSLPLDPIFSSTDAACSVPYGLAANASHPTTDDSSASASTSPAKDPTVTWKAPVVPNISLMDDATTEMENDDDDEEEEATDDDRPPELPSFGGVSAILDDLGSLEPTVLDGEESILDHDDDEEEEGVVPPPPPPLVKAASSAAPSHRATKLFSPWPSVLSAPSKKRPRLIKGYRLLDDSDMESASSAYFYRSPPLEILTLNLSTEQEEDLHLSDAGHASVGTATYSKEEPEPYLEFSDVDDDDEEEEEENKAGRPERSQVLAAHRTRRNKRHDRSSDRSSQASSASGGSLNRSLLSVTIAEETALDLEEDASSSSDVRSPVPMQRSQSAPNLAGFYSSSSRKGRDEIYDDIRMTGIHQYHAAHIFRQKPSSSNRSEYEGSHGQRRRRKQLLEPRDRAPLRPPAHRQRTHVPSLFRVERALRAGIHDHSLDQEDEMAELLSDGDSSSVPSEPRSLRYRNARIARLKRLQQHMPHHTNYIPKVSNAAPYVSLPNIPLPVTTPADSVRNAPLENHSVEPVIAKSSVTNVKIVSSPVDPVNNLHISSSSSSSSGLPKEEEEPNEALNTSGYASSVIDDSIGGDSYLIDLLDVQLAELNRPEGSMVGPDEASL